MSTGATCSEWIEGCLKKIEAHFRTVNPDAFEKGVFKDHVKHKFENDLMTIHDHYGLGCAYGTIALHRERKTHQWILNVQFETAQDVQKATAVLHPAHGQDPSAFNVTKVNTKDFFIAPIGGHSHPKVAMLPVDVGEKVAEKGVEKGAAGQMDVVIATGRVKPGAGESVPAFAVVV